MKNTKIIFLSLTFLLLLSGCADNSQINVPDIVNGNEYISGFFTGIFHGLFIWFSLIASIFSDAFNIYEPNNNGLLYNIGYIIGLFFLGIGTNEANK